ncbi:MAG: alpha/beta hydrolase [Candidatus Eiseniibacteriota bacterium]
MRRGRVVMEWVESEVLRGNPCGDPHLRRMPVYLPPSYDDQPQRRYPVVFLLTGFTSRGRALLNDAAWSPPIDDRMDALIERERQAPGTGSGEMILAMPDCLTRYGGSQYLNSSAFGRYQDHLIEELVPWLDQRFRTMADRVHRGVAGKSSGGFGALVLGMRHAGTFGAIACHSGDMGFDYCYRVDIPRFCTLLQEAGGIEKWFAAFESKVQKSKDDFLVLNLLAMAAAYSPNPRAAPFGIDLPCDLETGEFRNDVWARWLEFDPLRMVEAHTAALSSLALLYFDCGTQDEFHLQHGARALGRRLTELKIRHQREEFVDGHMNVTYRYEVSLPRLARALGATP